MPTLAEFLAKHEDVYYLKPKAEKAMACDVISTGNFAIDNLVIGAGGIPRGRITEIFSDAGVGKTTLVTQAIAQAQKKGIKSMICDVEHTFNVAYAKSLGVDPGKLLMTQPSSGEEALGIMREAIETKEIGLVICDSVANLTPKAEIDGDIGDSHVGLLARLMSQSMRILASAASLNNVALVFTNQERENIKTMGYGQARTTTGGLALKYYSTLRLDLTNIGQIKQGEERVGHQVKVVAVKNKLFPPFRQAIVDFRYGVGFDNDATLLDLAQKYTEAVTYNKPYWTILGTKCQGRMTAIAHVRDTAGVANTLAEAVRSALNGLPVSEDTP